MASGRNRNGIVLYQGPSSFDGSPIVVILTGLDAGGSDNAKTGGMLQTWIMRADMPPGDALLAGADPAVCGDCIHRSKASGGSATCYVEVHKAPRGVWHCWRRGGYGSPVSHAVACRVIAASLSELRIGSYGDPAAVPIPWGELAASARAHTGYTHAWKRPEGEVLRGVVMASADTLPEARAAWDAGWATFRVSAYGDATRDRGEARCPASAEAGKRTTCDTCPLKCNGAITGSGRVLGRVIQAHGGARKRVRGA